MSKLKKQLDQRIEAGLLTSPSRIVLNWGRYGSGKTHAANYYTRTDFIQQTFEGRAKNIKVNLPRSSKDPVQAFLRGLAGQLNFNNIIKDFAELKTEFGARLYEIIDTTTQDAVIARFIRLLLGKEEPTLFPEGIDIAEPDALQSYLYGDTSKATLSKLNLPLGLDDDEQVVNLISGIFNCLTFDKKLYKAVFLWIDEFEDIDTMPRSSQDRFTTFLRQLLDKTPNNLTIFLNLTLKGTTEFQDLSIFLGEALSSRTKVYMEFDAPSEEEAIGYVNELLNHPTFRDPAQINKENLSYPFSVTTLKEIIGNVGRVSIRKINETLSLILELALLAETTPTEIDLKFVHGIRGELVHWKQ